jgi:hypothetical protein
MIPYQPAPAYRRSAEAATFTRGLEIGGWPRPTLRGATQRRFCKLPASNADTLAGKRRQDADGYLKVPRIMPLLEVAQCRFQHSAGLATSARSEIK